LRFAVHRPGIPEASLRSHGVPRRDVPGRVHISVANETAGRTGEPRLTLTRASVYVPARRAPLAREMRFDFLYPAGRLVLQAAHQHAPPGPQDLAVQPGFLADVPARVPGSSPGRASHGPDLQVLDADHVETPGDLCSGLLDPVFAPVGLVGFQPGDRVLDPRAAVRFPHGAGELALQPPQPFPFPRGQARYMQQFSGRQGRGHHHPPVDSHHLTVTWCRHLIGNGGEGDVPASGPVHSHPVGFHAWRHWPGPAEPHPSGLRNPDVADVTRRAAHVPLPPAPPHDPEPLIPTRLSPCRPPGRVLRVEERSHRLGEVAQRLLLHSLRAFGQPGVLRAGSGELSALLQVARRALPTGVPVRVLLDGEVPHVPGVRAVVPQHGLLGVRGEQSVPGHTNILSIDTDISEEVKRRVLPGLRAGKDTVRS
jgi:hypothetical protein